MLVRVAAVAAVAAACVPAAQAVEHLTLRHEGAERQVSGELVVEAADGGLLLLAPDGVLWPVQPDEVIARTADETDFVPLTADELEARLLAQLPAGFAVHHTQHYLICYNTSRAYAQWCGGLFERLYRAFTNYWSQRDFELSEPRFPLVAVVFADAAGYREFARPELSDTVDSIVGYYSLQTNRMTMHDLTGIESLRRPGDRRGSSEQINAMLNRPEAERSVATIIHEATHQIAFNCGLQQRFADIPLWVCEGLAVYFETPDLGSGRGWRTIGAVNRVRLAGFRDYLPRRPAGSLESLLAGDERLRNARDAQDAYSEAWALNYFLLRQRPRQYEEYLKRLSEKRPFVRDDPAARLREFQAIFGEDLQGFDQEFLKHISKVR